MAPRIAPDDPFVGLWQFEESTARYELGAPPRDASYDISTDGDKYTMNMRWTSSDGHVIEQSYKAIPDGYNYEFADSPGIDSFSMDRVDERTLDTTARKNGEVVSHATRVLSEDGNTMTITTLVVTPTGERYTNVAIYHRARPRAD